MAQPSWYLVWIFGGQSTVPPLRSYLHEWTNVETIVEYHTALKSLQPLKQLIKSYQTFNLTLLCKPFEQIPVGYH